MGVYKGDASYIPIPKTHEAHGVDRSDTKQSRVLRMSAWVAGETTNVINV